MLPPVIDEIPGTDPGLVSTLADADQPTADLAEPDKRFFRFRDHQGGLIGFIGIEQGTDHVALLRSLVVVPSARGRGWGAVIAHWALNHLAERGVSDIWLMTTNTEWLASRLGFVRVARDAAPEAIRNSEQFSELCPLSAVLMQLSAEASSKADIVPETAGSA